jgi:hypothetical protein
MGNLCKPDCIFLKASTKNDSHNVEPGHCVKASVLHWLKGMKIAGVQVCIYYK